MQVELTIPEAPSATHVLEEAREAIEPVDRAAARSGERRAVLIFERRLVG